MPQSYDCQTQEGEHTARIMVGTAKWGILPTEAKRWIISPALSRPLVRDKLIMCGVNQYGFGRDDRHREKTDRSIPRRPDRSICLPVRGVCRIRVTHDPTSLMHQSTEELYIRNGMERTVSWIDRPGDVGHRHQYVYQPDGKGMSALESGSLRLSITALLS